MTLIGRFYIDIKKAMQLANAACEGLDQLKDALDKVEYILPDEYEGTGYSLADVGRMRVSFEETITTTGIIRLSELPFTLVLVKKCPAIVRQLVEEGYLGATKKCCGLTLLHQAAISLKEGGKNEDTILLAKLLIGKGVDVNAKSERSIVHSAPTECTALTMLASASKAVEMDTLTFASLLLASDADPSILNSQKGGPHYYAAREGNMLLYDLLIDVWPEGAYAKPDKGCAPFRLAGK